MLDRLRTWYYERNADRILSERPAEYAGTNTDFVRFVILAHQRSGSSMLASTLNKHEQVLCFGELFVPNRIGHLVKGFDGRSPALLHLRRKDPVAFLEKHAFRPCAPGIRAVGFKLFPDHLDKPGMVAVRDHVIADRDLRVVFLTRENLLEVYASLVIANRTGVFGINDPAKRQTLTIEVDPAEAVTEFERRMHYQQNMRERLDGHTVLDITYEELIADLDAGLARVQQFLGVPAKRLAVSTVKQEVRPLSEVIANYGELRRAWAGTRWEAYL